MCRDLFRRDSTRDVSISILNLCQLPLKLMARTLTVQVPLERRYSRRVHLRARRLPASVLYMTKEARHVILNCRTFGLTYLCNASTSEISLKFAMLRQGFPDIPRLVRIFVSRLHSPSDVTSVQSRPYMMQIARATGTPLRGSHEPESSPKS